MRTSTSAPVISRVGLGLLTQWQQGRSKHFTPSTAFGLSQPVTQGQEGQFGAPAGSLDFGPDVGNVAGGTCLVGVELCSVWLCCVRACNTPCGSPSSLGTAAELQKPPMRATTSSRWEQSRPAISEPVQASSCQLSQKGTVFAHHSEQPPF